MANEVFSLLFLNPPYDDEEASDGESKRTELAFLQRCTPYLMQGKGVLAYIIPRRVLHRTARFLAANYFEIRCLDFPADERENFGQIIVFGKRRKQPAPDPDKEYEIHEWADAAPEDTDQKMFKGGMVVYPLEPQPRRKVLFANLFLDPESMADEAGTKGLWASPLIKQVFRPVETKKRNPLMPLRDGHIGMLAAAGMLNNLTIDTDDGRRILMKGRTYKEYVTKSSTEAKIVRQEQIRTNVVLLDLENGRFEEIRA